MVLTYRWAPDSGFGALGAADSLAAASAQLPAGSYTTLRTYGRDRVLRLGQHVARLVETAGLLGAGAPALQEADARRLLRHAIAAAGFSESRLRLTWVPPALFASVEAFAPPPEALYRQGVRCVTLPVRRENPHAKDTRFIATAQAAYGSLPAGVHEGLLLAADDALLEGLSSNFFAVIDATLRTEGERVLFGVTRSLVLEVAAGLMPVVAAAVTRSELHRASDAFITSVSRGIVPVVEIDGTPIGNGRPGAATLRLRTAFAELEAREAQPV
jgi:branched-chain amino acid aminotransferase